MKKFVIVVFVFAVSLFCGCGGTNVSPDAGQTADVQQQPACKDHADCPQGQLCNKKAGECWPECRVDRDCLAREGDGRVCYNGACKKGSEICLDGSARVCGEIKGACRPGTQICQNGDWSDCKDAVTSTEEICDKLDNDCDGEVDEDCPCFDGQTQLCATDQGACHKGVQTCQDGKWGVCDGEGKPSPEICDGLDNDCDSVIDEMPLYNESAKVGDPCKGIGECPGGVWECDGKDKLKCSASPDGSVYVHRNELCDNKDNDCDGGTDEDFSVGAACGVGQCEGGVLECLVSATGTICNTMPGGSKDKSSKTETCDNKDNTCDGTMDEGCACSTGTERECGPEKGKVGECRLGTQDCVNGVWEACEGATYPSADVCDGKDNDCDGATDNPFRVGQSCPALGECGAGVLECDGLYATRCSTYAGGSASQSVKEICDKLDNDCDGNKDEDFFVDGPCRGDGVCGLGKLECDTENTTRCSTSPKGSQNQSSAEICDNLDNDCDNVTDNGVKNACNVCGVLPSDGPGACDNKDNDCDGATDEGCSCVTGAVRGCGINVGACKQGTQTCDSQGQWSNCAGGVDPSADGPQNSCDGLDNDCDGGTDEGCACKNYQVNVCGSNVGICKQGIQTCYGNVWTACANQVVPAPGELCNGLDDDCNSAVPTNEVDADGDGVMVCASDCDDSNIFVRPGMPEICNGVNDDCDSDTDEGFQIGLLCQGKGECGTGVWECDGVAATTTRCSVDIGSSHYAGTCDGPPSKCTGVDACDNLDNDCDGIKDNNCDCVSGNTFVCGPSQGNVGQCRIGTQTCVNGIWGPCQGAVYSSQEICDGVDNDCDNAMVNEVDADGDGFKVCANDCNDNAFNINPNITDVCDGINNDCDSQTDEGYFVGAPCGNVGQCGAGVFQCTVSATATVCSTMPGGLQDQSSNEVCDGADNDCDRTTDEGVKNACGQCGPVPGDGPANNACDGLDNNCDGVTDEGCGCVGGEKRACGSNVGECRKGIQACVAQGIWSATCQDEVVPGVEACDNKDNDCDGVTDNGCGCVHGAVQQCGATDVGECQYGLRVCNAGVWGSCNSVEPTPEICDSKDNNCDGSIDNGVVCPAVFVWTPPNQISANFNLYGCFGTTLRPDGKVECLGWDVLCAKQNVTVLNCELEIPPGSYLQVNAARSDGLWMVNSNVLNGTESLSRGGQSVTGTILYVSDNDESLLFTVP
ncbi:MAG: putative metal-binding motif-containing protein [bacterium]|nr:putative metal-binding motif-containing protein [bacterium]